MNAYYFIGSSACFEGHLGTAEFFLSAGLQAPAAHENRRLEVLLRSAHAVLAYWRGEWQGVGDEVAVPLGEQDEHPYGRSRCPHHLRRAASRLRRLRRRPMAVGRPVGHHHRAGPVRHDHGHAERRRPVGHPARHLHRHPGTGQRHPLWDAVHPGHADRHPARDLGPSDRNGGRQDLQRHHYPVAGATVQADGAHGTWELTTDTSGSYGLSLDASNSPLTLIVSAPGYQAQATVVTVKAGATTTHNFTLTPTTSCG